MWVYKLTFLILCVIFIDLNLLAANDELVLETAAGQYGSKMGRNAKHMENLYVEHKRAKREDDTAQGKVHFIIESFVVKC